MTSVTAYEEAAFGGDSHVVYLPSGGGACRLPPRIAKRARSLVVHLASQSVILLTGGGGRQAVPRVRYLSQDAPHFSAIFPSPLAICLGSRVSGVALYPEALYAGQVMLLWRGSAATAGEASSTSTSLSFSSPAYGRGGWGSGGANGTSGGHPAAIGEPLECVGIPPSVRSLRLIGDEHAVAVTEGSLLALTDSLGYVGGGVAALGGAGAHQLMKKPGSGAITTVCVGHGLRAAVFQPAVGRVRTLRAPPAAARQRGASDLRLPENAAESADESTGAAGGGGGGTLWRLRGISSIRLLRRMETVELLGTVSAGDRSLVLSADSSRLPALDFAVTRVAFGCSVREVELYRAPNFEGGKRLRLRQTAAACANPPSTSSPTLSSASAALGGALVDLPPSWRGTVRSMVLVRECAASNLLCDHRHDDEDDDEGGAAASEGAAGLPAMAATEFRIPAAGEILPYRTPLAPPLGFPAHLAAFARGTFQAYNPSLVVERDGTLTCCALVQLQLLLTQAQVQRQCEGGQGSADELCGARHAEYDDVAATGRAFLRCGPQACGLGRHRILISARRVRNGLGRRGPESGSMGNWRRDGGDGGRMGEGRRAMATHGEDQESQRRQR